MKKVWAILLLGLFLINFVVAALGDIEDTLDSSAKKVEGIEDNLETLSEEDEKWNYLGEELEKIVMKNSVVKGLDSFMKKSFISFPFKILFGVEYAFSLIVLISVILWFFFLVKFNEMTSIFSTFSSGTSLVISLSLVVVLAQMSFYKNLAGLIFKLIFYREGWWGWIATGIVIFIFVLISFFIKMAKKQAIQNREEMEADRLEGNKRAINLTGEALTNALLPAQKQKFNFIPGMRRTGDSFHKKKTLPEKYPGSVNQGSFVSKKSAERYARRFNDDAAIKRFGSPNLPKKIKKK